MGLFLGEGFLGEGPGLAIAAPLVLVELTLTINRTPEFDLTINRTVTDDLNLSN